MKTSIVLKEFSALPSSGVRVTHATALANVDSQPPAPIKSSDLGKGFWEMQPHRYTMPFESVIPYHRWGINV